VSNWVLEGVFLPLQNSVLVTNSQIGKRGTDIYFICLIMLFVARNILGYFSLVLEIAPKSLPWYSSICKFFWSFLTYQKNREQSVP